MAYEQLDNSGSVFKNERRREGKNDSQYAGSSMIDGKEYWTDIWVKNPKMINGQPNPDYKPDKKTFFSLSFRPKDKPAAAKSQPPARRAAPPRPPSQEPDRSLGNERDF
jgi:hypothetical protein